jgi:two-component system, chemotaxis family, CheB/CheR fusion protein
VSVTFLDVTELADVSERLEDSKRQLATAYEELQSTVEELETTNEELQSTNEELETTNEELQSTNEELETMNEELQSTNEELETTNEELQSTNEELETMNEELQSTNDELEAMNDQQRERSDEMDRLNVFLEGILGNLGVGVVVLDENQRVQVWNSSAHELWGLRGEEVSGQQFLLLDIGLPVDQVRDAIRDALGNGRVASTATLEAVNRRGRSFRCTIRTLPLVNQDHAAYGVMLLMSPETSDLPLSTPAD